MTRLEKISTIRNLPSDLEALVSSMNDAQLDTPYRKDGWTVRQVVHHLVDSHANAYIRCKLTLTEEYPTIRPYDQDAWAELPDGKTAPIANSLMILRGLHDRWANMFEAIQENQWQRKAFHPDNGDMTLDDFLNAYSAHGINHLNHIRLVADGHV